MKTGRCKDCGKLAGTVDGIWYCPECDMYKDEENIDEEV